MTKPDKEQQLAELGRDANAARTALEQHQQAIGAALKDPVRRDIDRRLGHLEQQVGSVLSPNFMAPVLKRLAELERKNTLLVEILEHEGIEVPR